MAFASQSEAGWIALVFWHDVKLELLKYWSWPLYGCLKSIAPHSPSQQTEVRNLSILAKSGLGFQNNLSGINCSVGIFRVLGFMDANHLLIKDVIHKAFPIVSMCEFAFRCCFFCVAKEVAHGPLIIFMDWVIIFSSASTVVYGGVLSEAYRDDVKGFKTGSGNLFGRIWVCLHVNWGWDSEYF